MKLTSIVSASLLSSAALAAPGALKIGFNDVVNAQHPQSGLRSFENFLNQVVGGPEPTQAQTSAASASSLSDSAISNVTLTTGYNFYLTNISVGTPPQSIQVGLDTGSPYLWVFGPQTTYNSAKQFFPNESSSYVDLHSDFSSLYGAGGVFGKWGADSVHVGDDEVLSFPFGVVNDYNLAAGVPALLGVGPGPNLTNETYTNVPEALYRQNVTKSAAFSITLFGDTTGGEVIFGGVDRTKFIEPVYEYDIVSSGANSQYYYQLGLTSLALNGDEYDVLGLAVLDTGSPFCQVPPGFVNKTGEALNFTFYEKYQVYYTQKDTAINQNLTVSVNIGIFTADIPIADLIVPGEYVWGTDGPQGVNALALMGAPNYLLGDAFFKNAYAIFDSLSKKIYLAKAVGSDATPEIIDLDERGIPGAVPGTTYNSYTWSQWSTRPTASPQPTILPNSFFYPSDISDIPVETSPSLAQPSQVPVTSSPQIPVSGAPQPTQPSVQSSVPVELPETASTPTQKPVLTSPTGLPQSVVLSSA